MKYIRGKLWDVIDDNTLPAVRERHAHEIIRKTADAVSPVVDDVVYEAVRLEGVLNR